MLLCGDCLEILPTLPENSVDAIVTDPPYELGFMGRSWDRTGIALRPETWAAFLRVLKPGGHMTAFAAVKNEHRMVCAIEDAGFEIRDKVLWLFGTGFPKSHDVSKGIDKAAGAEREVIGVNAQAAAKANKRPSGDMHNRYGGGINDNGATITAPATDAARQWEGWGTALKPAYEPICLARKPLSEKSVTANVLRWGTGALNIDATRILPAQVDDYGRSPRRADGTKSRSSSFGWGSETDGSPLGRWPANVVHDGSDEVLNLFPESKSTGGSGPASKGWRGDGHTIGAALAGATGGFGDSGSAARFFYCAKASKADRAGSKHPTVKPIKLMRWLVRMVTPMGGTVLDPFSGSGTTGAAAILEGFWPLLIEREPEYQADIRRRLENIFAE